MEHLAQVTFLKFEVHPGGFSGPLQFNWDTLRFASALVLNFTSTLSTTHGKLQKFNGLLIAITSILKQELLLQWRAGRSICPG